VPDDSGQAAPSDGGGDGGDGGDYGQYGAPQYQDDGSGGDNGGYAPQQAQPQWQGPFYDSPQDVPPDAQGVMQNYDRYGLLNPYQQAYQRQAQDSAAQLSDALGIVPTDGGTGPNQWSPPADFGQTQDQGASQPDFASGGMGQQTGGDATGDGSMGDAISMSGEGGQSLSCYVQDNKLCCLAVVNTPLGVVPMSACIRLREPHPDGPVKISGDALEPVSTALANQTAYETLKREAESVVIRARNGDQHAMAVLACVAEDASNPQNVQARAFKQAVEEYIHLNPVSELPGMVSLHGEGTLVSRSEAPNYRAAVRMANSLQITPERIATFGHDFAGRHERARHVLTASMAHGMSRFGDDEPVQAVKSQVAPGEVPLVDLGHTIGLAVGLQRVRSGAHLEDWSPDVAWELC
jgi:hypothetical protein